MAMLPSSDQLPLIGDLFAGLEEPVADTPSHRLWRGKSDSFPGGLRRTQLP